MPSDGSACWVEHAWSSSKAFGRTFPPKQVFPAKKKSFNPLAALSGGAQAHKRLSDRVFLPSLCAYFPFQDLSRVVDGKIIKIHGSFGVGCQANIFDEKNVDKRPVDDSHCAIWELVFFA
jgi:hypothetical protein